MPGSAPLPTAPMRSIGSRALSGYQTDLEFETGETFVGLGAGDIEGISFVAQDNHLFLKPKAAKVGTNLTILTTRRTYQLDYSALPQAPDASEEVTYALRFTYPPVAKEEGSHERPRCAERPRSRNIDYWFCGDPSLKPIAASDDGVHTRLTFAAEGRAARDLHPERGRHGVAPQLQHG